MAGVPTVTSATAPRAGTRDMEGARDAASVPSRLSPATVLRLSGAVMAPESPVPVGADPVAMRAAAAWGAPASVRTVAAMPDLDGETARAVFDRGDWPALRKLAANASTRLPDDVRDGLVAASESDSELADALAARGDRPERDAAAARGRTRQPAPPAGEKKTGEFSGIDVAELRRSEEVDGIIARASKADANVDLLAKLRPLRPADIAYCLSLGRIDEAMSVISRIAGVPTPGAIKAYEQGDIGYALQQMRSIGLDPFTANWLLRGLNRVPGARVESTTAASAYVAAASASSGEPSDAPGSRLDLRL